MAAKPRTTHFVDSDFIVQMGDRYYQYVLTGALHSVQCLAESDGALLYRITLPDRLTAQILLTDLYNGA